MRVHPERVGDPAGLVHAPGPRPVHVQLLKAGHVGLHAGSADASDHAFDPAVPREIAWADGEGGEKVLAVPLVPDALPEGDEHFFVFIGSPSGGATIAGPDGATVTILGDASPEGPESFDVVLSNPTGGAALGVASVRVTITE
jgi:hypothetical protein